MRFATENAVAYFWAEIFRNAIPEDEVFGINFRHLLILTPLVIALGKKKKKNRKIKQKLTVRSPRRNLSFTFANGMFVKIMPRIISR